MAGAAAAWAQIGLLPLAGAALVCALLTWGAIAYAQSRGLLDLPGRRRSHRQATPRGGGVGIVVATLATGLLPMALGGDAAYAWIALALLATAGIGWLDDHRPLRARSRLLVHLLSAALVAWAVLGLPPDSAGIAGLLLVVLLLAWSINLHNFIDGINGLLALQGTAILGMLAWFAARAGDTGLAQVAGCAAVACLAFVPFNLPRARIFLGDVGSGAIGLLVGACGLLAWRHDVLDAGALLMLVSAGATDASLTLLSRMRAGRRWYRPHREHLYQWLVRSGASHAQVALAYLAWTAVLVPLLLLAREEVLAGEWADASPRWADTLYFAGWPAATLGLAAATWMVGKRACHRRARAARKPCAQPT